MTAQFTLDDYATDPDDLDKPELIMLYGPYGQGKELAYGTPVLTPEGWVNIEDINKGDFVVGLNGLLTQVTGVYDQGVKPMYRVEFNDGAWVDAGWDHQWLVTTRRGVSHVVTTGQLIEGWGAGSRLTVPTVHPVMHSSNDLPLDPYVLGSLLADGYLHGDTIMWTKNDQKVVDEVHSRVPIREVTVPGYARRFKFVDTVRPILRELELEVASASKFIPEIYFTASVQQRFDLLAGLFDGDGSVHTNDGRSQALYHTTSSRLGEGVLQLLWSLGISAKKSFVKSDGTWRVAVLGTTNPFGVTNQDISFHATRGEKRRIINISECYESLARCISVDSPDQLYVIKDYIVTHNTWLAASISELPEYANVAYIDTEGSTSGVLKDFDKSRITVVRPRDVFPAGQEWPKTIALIKKLLNSDNDYTVIVIDAFDVLFEWGLAYYAAEKPNDGFHKWNEVHEKLTSPYGLVYDLKRSSKLGILVVHEKKEGGDDDSPTFADFMWQGQGRSKLGQFPDLVGYVTRDTNSGGVSTTTLHTAPTKRSNAKNRFNLPAKIVGPTMKTVYDLIEHKED